MIVFFAQRALDEVVSQASRVIQTGQAQTSALTQAQFASLVCQNTVILFTCGNFMINVQSYGSFSSAGSVAANQTPINIATARTGASFEIKASPTGARWSSPMVASRK